jgi:hypothetical protein
MPRSTARNKETDARAGFVIGSIASTLRLDVPCSYRNQPRAFATASTIVKASTAPTGELEEGAIDI